MEINEFIEEIKSGLNPIDRIKEYTNSNGGWTYEENIFSICKLRKCTIAQEKLAIEEFLSTCNKRNCNKRSSQQPVRDVLLISIFVLEHLISQEKYLEAERIRIQTPKEAGEVDKDGNIGTVEILDTAKENNFDPENIEPGIYDVTFGTKGYEYKVDTTDKYEVDDMVGLMFQPEDIHIMSRNNY